MSELPSSGEGEPPPSYMIFLVVFLFFLTGLLGFLICHLLKKKGYRCRTGDMEDEEEEEKLGENEDDEHEGNQDTVEQILKCILENEANMEAFNEMLGNHNVCVRHDPRLRKESIGGVPPHLHTVHSGTDHNTCHLCAQVRSKKGRRQSRTPRFKQRPGEQTVFSVGRFRVTHTDKKLHGGAASLAASGEQLDRSQDSEERKEGGYNLRSMFKEVRPPADGANGVAANVGRRKKSVTIFGLRRGSDPVGMRVKQGAGRDIGELRFTFKQPPVVVEEPQQTADPEHRMKPGAQSEPEPDAAQRDAKASGSVGSQSESKAFISSSSPRDGSEPGANPEPQTKTSTRSSVASAPSSLPVSSERRTNVDGTMEDMFDPGPLQTSTPITPIPTSTPAFIPMMPTGQSEPFSPSRFSVDQSSPDPSSSPEPGFGAGLPLISLGSSPHISLAESSSPQSSSKNVSSEAVEAAFSPGTTSSPQLLSGPAASSQGRGSSSSLGPNGSPGRSISPSKNIVSSSFTSEVQEAEGSLIPKRPGILKTSKLSPAAPAAPAGPGGSGFSSPSDQPLKDKRSTLPLSHFSPVSPSSPEGTRISSVIIVKASPDSKREFSVVTMLEDEGAPAATSDQKGGMSELEVTSASPAAGRRGNVSVSNVEESEETLEVEVRPPLMKDKEDLVEMEDIRDCKVTQAEGVERREDQVEERMEG